MNQVQEIAGALTAAIKECREYEEYQKARTDIAQYPALKREADKFRRMSYDLQRSGADIFSEGDRLGRDCETTLKNPVVRAYLDAENAFCRILRQVNWQLLESLDFELDFER